MKFRNAVLIASVCSVLVACGGGNAPMPPAGSSPVNAQSTGAVPADHPEALPGDHPEALPGTQLGCDLTFAVDQANCTVAVNINIPPISNPTTPASLLPGFHPADLQSRYVLPSQNAGGTVAIVDAYDDPSAQADMAVYRSAFGLPACTNVNGCFTKVNEQGQTTYPAPNVGWDEEISLDLDMVSAVCPNCKILLVEANSPSFDDLGASVDTAAALGAVAISNSYYGPEWSGESSEDAHYRHAGIAITVSSGDQRSPFYPAAAPYVTSVGGSTLSFSSGTWTETPWKYDGDGCSHYEARPSFQPNICQGMRSTVDVTAVADPQTGVTMYDSSAGGWLVTGGTSVGAPLIAAAYALSGNPQGPAFSYAHRRAFFDLGARGYDLPTGLGSPNGVGGL